MKRSIVISLFLVSTILINSCKKNMSEEVFTETIIPVRPDLTTPVSASVAGFITDENGEGLASASVKAGTLTVTTNSYGYFEIDNVTFAKSAGFVQVTSPGYFTGVRTFLPAENRKTFLRLQLVRKTIAGTISATDGGTVSDITGTSVTLPANGVVMASSGTAYTGNVNISMHWLDPSDQTNTQLAMPGDLRAIDSSGNLKTLTTYGMIAVELSGSGGELLQVAPGLKAALHFPLPAALQSTAPAMIPLWYFNEQNGLWEEEGFAIKNGNGYDGEVGHFSWWNADVPNSVVNFDAQIVNPALKPLNNVAVSIGINNVPNSFMTFYSDSSGRLHGMMPANRDVVLKIGATCNPLVFSRAIVTTNTNVDLGTIVVDAPQHSATFSGMVNKCSGLPVTNGYVLIAAGGVNEIAEVTNGAFYTQTLICAGTLATLIAFDRENSETSLPQNSTLVTGFNDFGTTQACNAAAVETISYSMDSGPVTTLSNPFFVFTGAYDPVINTTTITAFDQINSATSFQLTFSGPDNTVGPHSIIGTVLVDQVSYLAQVTPVTVIAYGLISEFITGSCTISLTDTGGMPHTLTCTFSIKRDS